MSLFQAIFGGFNAYRSRNLLLRAFDLADAGDFVNAADLLKYACQLSPNDPSVWNESAYCFGKMGKFDVAKEAAIKAIALDPTNPKFHVSLVGSSLDEAFGTTSAAGLDRLLVALAPQVTAMMKLEPYPSAILMNALFRAFHGASEAEWMGILQDAESLYQRQGRDSIEAGNIIENNRLKCVNASAHHRMLQGSK